MKEIGKIRDLIRDLKRMISDGQLDRAQKENIWGHIRQLEGLVRKFRQKKSSKANRNELTSSFAKLAEDLVKMFGPKE